MSTKGHAEPLAMWTMARQPTFDGRLASRCFYECYSVFARDCAAVTSYASPAENDRCQAVSICMPFSRFCDGSWSSSIAKNVMAIDPRRALRLPDLRCTPCGIRLTKQISLFPFHDCLRSLAKYFAKSELLRKRFLNEQRHVTVFRRRNRKSRSCGPALITRGSFKHSNCRRARKWSFLCLSEPGYARDSLNGGPGCTNKPSCLDTG